MGECRKSNSFCSECVTCPCCQTALPAPCCWGLSTSHSCGSSAPYEEGAISPLFSLVHVYLASLGPTVLVFFRVLTELEFYGFLLVIHDKLRGVISKMQQGAWAQAQGWQSNDSSLLAGTFHYACLINDSTSQHCPGGELSTTQWLLFSLSSDLIPYAATDSTMGMRSYPETMNRSWRSRAAGGTCVSEQGAVVLALDLRSLWSRERLRGAEGDGHMELARKMFFDRKKHEPEICASACSFVSWAGGILFCRHSASSRCFSHVCCCSGTCVRKPSTSLQGPE